MYAEIEFDQRTKGSGPSMPIGSVDLPSFYLCDFSFPRVDKDAKVFAGRIYCFAREVGNDRDSWLEFPLEFGSRFFHSPCFMISMLRGIGIEDLF